jgi:hypothetical protein
MPLSVDQIRQLQTRIALPSGSVPGTRLTWLGPTDEDIDWTSEPDQQVFTGHGNPNTLVNAPKGTLYVDVDAPALWINDDGVATWSKVGAVSSFPVGPLNDGTSTFKITATPTGSGTMTTSVQDDSTTLFAENLIQVSPTFGSISSQVISPSGAQAGVFPSAGSAGPNGNASVLLQAVDNVGDGTDLLLNEGGLIRLRGVGALNGILQLGIAGSTIGFFGGGPNAQPTVTGSRGGNAALASLLTGLANLGLIINSSTP